MKFRRLDACSWRTMEAATILLSILILSSASSSDAQEPATDPVEATAVFDVLQGINFEIDWRSMFPGDPCTGGPHGVVCDIDVTNVYHVVELNLGWVSDYINNPPCSYNASIHPSIFKFTRLRKLFFYRCFVHSPVTIPADISLLGRSLQHLTFQNNPLLVGAIPDEVANLTHLERLVLTENSLEGPIPSGIGNLKKLKQLALSHNRLDRSVPKSIGGLESLVILDLSENQLAGQIPGELYSLRELQKVDLSHNLLQGPIEDSIGNLHSLVFLDFSYNNLSGEVPQELGQVVSLQNLFLGNNRLGGKLPNIWDSLSGLIALGLSSSRYAGPIPPSLGELKKLNSLSLDGNQFSGAIPATIGSLPNLYHMNLSANFLNGPVPFTPGLVGRLGRNLLVKNNTGLCYELSLQDTISDTSGLLPCGNSPTSSLSGQTPAGMPGTKSSADKSLTATFLCLFWILLV